MHIALFTDATSLEKEVGEKSIVLFKDSLDKLGHTYKVIQRPTMKDEFLQTYKTFDLGIPVIHWWYGEGGQITALLELLWIPYLFSDHDVHSLCFNKYATNLIAKDIWANIPKTYHLNSTDQITEINFDWPFFIKPNSSWSSLDCGKFNDLQQAKSLITKICNYDTALVQQAIKWRELTVSVQWKENPSILGIMEVLTQRDFFDYDAKYKRKQTKEIFLDLEQNLKKEIENISLKMYKKFRLTDIARIDFLLADNLYFLEVNTIPGMTPMSFLPQCVKKYGYAWFEIFLDELMKKKLLTKI